MLDKSIVMLMIIGMMSFLVGLILLAAGWTMDYWDLLYVGRRFIESASCFFFLGTTISICSGFIKKDDEP